jgi:hypothetical protein
MINKIAVITDAILLICYLSLSLTAYHAHTHYAVQRKSKPSFKCNTNVYFRQIHVVTDHRTDGQS